MSHFYPFSEGIRVFLKVTPKAASARIGKTFLNENNLTILRIYVTEAPEDGKANAAVIDLLAREWHLSKNQITLVKGHKDRLKTVEVSGNPEILLKKMKTTLF